MVYSIIQKSQLEGALRLDAEYYRPKYLEASRLLGKKEAKSLDNFLEDIRYGLYTEPNYQEIGVDFIRGLNLLDLGIGGEILKIEKKAVPNNNYFLRSDDILIARSGSVGAVGIISKDFAGSTFGSYTIRIRVKNFNPNLLYIFLKTRFGKLQIERLITQVAQPNINVPNLRLLKIPSFSTSLQKKIAADVSQIHAQKVKSESLYQQAEEMLLQQVGFDKISLKTRSSYITPLKETVADRRLDAEHFHTKFKSLRKHLEKTKRARPLGELRSFIKRGLQPKYVENGEIVVINSQHLGRTLLNIDDTPRTDRNFYEQNQRCQLRKNDVLFYSTGAYIGRTNAYLSDNQAIASNHVTIIRTTKECEPVYLAVYLNSLLGLMQADQWASGSAQREIYPDDIDKFLVYLPAPQFQQKIASLIHRSHQTRRESRELLEKAKRKIEAIIEK